MNPKEEQLSPEALLEQAGWVRRLAERLVASPDLREDVAQETLLIALEHRPSVLDPRAWLARLLRNTAWEATRAERRREHHSRRVVPRESPESPEELVGQAELQARIVVAVTKLAEPYRSTILQRYFRDRSPEEIARREELPAATVRSRLKRGLDQLRDHFRDEQETNRNAWLGLLVPWAMAEPALLTTTSAITIGGVTMKLGTILLGLAAAGLAIAIFVVAQSTDRPYNGSDGAAASETVVAVPKGGGEASSPDTGANVAPVVPAEHDAPRVGIATELSIAGRVLDEVTKEPVPTFQVLVTLKRRIGGETSGLPATVVDRHGTDPDGRFRFALEKAGVYRLQVHSRGHRSGRLDDLRIEGPADGIDLLVELDPGLGVSGVVVDDATGEPVPDAVVSTTRNSRLKALFLTGEVERCRHTRTDAEGRFHLTGLDAERQKIAAVHDDYAEAWQELVPGEVGAIELRLRRGPRVFGTAYDDAGQPREGVWIFVHGEEIPLARPLITGPDGAYRTPPVRPGTVELLARPPDGETNDSFGFSAEWAVARVEDADVRVDFGVRTDLVHWRGTLFGLDGRPLPRASLSIFFEPLSYDGYERLISHFRGSGSDNEGRFEFRKVPTGRYSVYVNHEGRSLLNGDRTVLLDTPGLHEEDLRLDQGDGPCRVRGVVLDEATVSPLETDGVKYVHAMQSSPGFRSWQAYIDEDGTFTFTGLPPGRTQFSAYAKGWVSRSITVGLREGEPVDDLRFLLPRSGTLHLCLDGFRELSPRTFSYTLRPEEGRRLGTNKGQLPENGVCVITRVLEPGSWTVAVSVEGLGAAERAFTVDEGRVAEVVISPQDLAATRRVTVAGDVKHEDGTPVPGIEVRFWGGDVPGIEHAERSRAVSTDASGAFEVTDLLPGPWQVRGTMDASSVQFPDFLLPANASDPHSLHLVIPGGRVVGALFDARTGQPLGEDAPKRWLFLGAPGAGRNVCEIQGGKTGSRFEMDGIPEGEYVLTVSANGFSMFASKPFAHPGAETVDLGRIELEPCGVLELEVVDGVGATVTGFEVFVDGRSLYSHEVRAIGEGWFQVSRLPLGPATIEVHAEEYPTAREELTFRAGEPLRHTFVLR